MNTRVGTALVALGAGLVAGWLARGEPAPQQVQVMAERPAGPKASSASLFYLHHDELRQYYPAGKEAGAWMAATIATGEPAGCRKAQEIWARVAATENFGGEYGALDWLCTWIISTPDTRQEMAEENHDGRRVARYLDEVGWQVLGKYLEQRYELTQVSATAGGESPATIPNAPAPRPQPGAPLSYQQLLFLHELLRFGGPQRAAWEHTDEVLAALRVGPGMDVVDLGAGNGFISFRMAPLVGDEGDVYALELDPTLISFIEKVKARESLTNLRTVENTLTSLTLPPDSVDLIWACNLYLNFYGAMREADRKKLMDDFKATLRPGGRLVISDNTPEGELSPGTLFYHGFAISPTLVVEQLEGYGFKLVGRHNFLEQRYVLEFVES